VMKMFDVLIVNKDRNVRNFLVDGDWHMVLIDHSGGHPRERHREGREEARPVRPKAGREAPLAGRLSVEKSFGELVAKQREARVFFN